jgi:hypothetical protein
MLSPLDRGKNPIKKYNILINMYLHFRLANYFIKIMGLKRQIPLTVLHEYQFMKNI